MFIASLLDGTLARRTGGILPGIMLHVLGDLARVYFGVLRGDASLLLVTERGDLVSSPARVSQAKAPID